MLKQFLPLTIISFIFDMTYNKNQRERESPLESQVHTERDGDPRSSQREMSIFAIKLLTDMPFFVSSPRTG